MKVQTKKIIAREFILLIKALALGFICFLGTYPYNYYRSSQTGNLDKTIAEKNKLTDSLSYQYKRKFQKKDWFFEKFNAKFDSDLYKNEELWNRLLYLAEKDSIKYIWNNWAKEFVDFNKELKFDIPQKLKEFINANRLKRNDSANYKESLKVNQEIRALKERKKEIEIKKLSFEEQLRFGVTSTIVLLIILFAARYLFYAVRWSIRVLKQKNEAIT